MTVVIDSEDQDTHTQAFVNPAETWRVPARNPADSQ